VTELFYVDEIRRQVAVYPWIEGVTLRDRLRLGNEKSEGRETFHRLGRFLGELHQKGISFEGGHLNNYLATPGGGHALIDVTDVMFYRSALARGARLRNLLKLARHPEDAELVRRLGWLPLLEGYREALTSLGVTQSMAGIVPEDL
jgi:tRNA A-37 threonylcarbamoyl transferase component Bud32